MLRSFQIAKVLGIPIIVHWTLVILAPYLAWRVTQAGVSFVWALLLVIGLFASVALHELGHSAVAIRKGCTVRKILLLPIGGVAQLVGLTEKPKDEFQIAIAGPLVSLALCLALMAGANLFGALTLQGLSVTCFFLSMVNFFLVAFNMIPSFPMDGGRVLRAWLTPRKGRLEATRIAARIGRFLATVFGIVGLLQFRLLWVAIAVFVYWTAGSEYRAVYMQEVMKRTRYSPWFGAEGPRVFEPSDNDVYVGPPPYEK